MAENYLKIDTSVILLVDVIQECLVDDTQMMMMMILDDARPVTLVNIKKHNFVSVFYTDYDSLHFKFDTI